MMSSNVLIGPDVTPEKVMNSRQTTQVARSDERYAQTTYNNLMLNVDAVQLSQQSASMNAKLLLAYY